MKYRILAAVFVVAAGVASVAAQSITATKAYVDRRYEDATNAVPSIVTNEVTSGWVCEIKEWGHLYEYRDPPVFWPEDETWYLSLWTEGGANKVDFYCRAPEDATELNFTPWLTLRRTRGNALGLARAKDLEKLPTHEDVTNVAREVVNTVWDAKLGVAWEARMHDGHLYYIAVTNAPGGAE